jgi:hypothetical protein
MKQQINRLFLEDFQHLFRMLQRLEIHVSLRDGSIRQLENSMQEVQKISLPYTMHAEMDIMNVLGRVVLIFYSI